MLAALAADDARPNASMQAIAEAYRQPPGWTATATAPFKSATKWSGVSYGDHGNWVIGAPDVLLDPASAAAEQAERIGAQGLRVLLLGAADVAVDHPDAPGRVTPVALVVLEQKVRPDARETMDYFAEQNVSVKVISGDNAVSVGAVAGKLGLHGETMDARQLPTDQAELADSAGDAHHVRPGAPRSEARHRARPAIARAHRRDDRRRRQRRAGPQGRRYRRRDGRGQPGVAGGRADRAAGQQVRHTAVCRRRGPAGDRQHRAGRQPVLDQDGVLGAAGTAGGYRCLFSKLLHADPLLYPFQPIHVTIAAWFTIGIPSFILSLAPNNERAHPGFVRRVLTSALPSGLSSASRPSRPICWPTRAATRPWQQQDQASTAALITLLVTAVWVLAVVARPYQWWRVALVVASALAYVVIFSLPVGPGEVHARPVECVVTSTALAIGVLGAAAIEAIWWIRAGCSVYAARCGARSRVCVDSEVTARGFRLGRPMGFLDKAKKLLSQNADKVETAIDKAGDIRRRQDEGQVLRTPSTRCRTRPRSSRGPARATGDHQTERMAKLSGSIDVRCRRSRPGSMPPICPGTRIG